MAKAPKTISAADKKAQLAGLKLALKQHSDNTKSISAAFKEAEKALAVAKKSSDAIAKEAAKAAEAKRKEATTAAAAAQKIFDAAVAKNTKATEAAAKGAEKLNGQIAALEAVPLDTSATAASKKVKAILASETAAA